MFVLSPYMSMTFHQLFAELHELHSRCRMMQSQITLLLEAFAKYDTHQDIFDGTCEDIFGRVAKEAMARYGNSQVKASRALRISRGCLRRWLELSKNGMTRTEHIRISRGPDRGTVAPPSTINGKAREFLSPGMDAVNGLKR